MVVFRKGNYTSGEKALTEAQIKKLFDYITNFEDLVLIEVAVNLGLRRGDVVAIKIKNINTERKTLSYFEQKKQCIRTVPVPQQLIKNIQMLIKINKTKKSNYLFPARYGTGHLSSKQAYNIFQMYLKKAELPPTPFHALRATCVKLYQKRGWTEAETAKLLGDSIRIIHEHYQTPSDEELAEAMETKPLL